MRAKEAAAPFSTACFFFAHGDPFSGKAACVYLQVVLLVCSSIGILLPLIAFLENDVLFSLLLSSLSPPGSLASHQRIIFPIFGSIVPVSVAQRSQTRCKPFRSRYKTPPPLPPKEPPVIIYGAASSDDAYHTYSLRTGLALLLCLTTINRRQERKRRNACAHFIPDRCQQDTY